MEGPRAATRNELDQVLELVNTVFRGKKKTTPGRAGMGEEFPLLFSENNLENIRIIIEDDKPVSHVGIVERPVLVYGYPMIVGSIGSVCTYEEYRGRGYATKLIQDTVAKLRREDVDVMLVSGTRGLYLRNGCAPAGRYEDFQITVDKITNFKKIDIKLVPYQESDLSSLVKFYQKEPLRYYRPLDDFKRLLQASQNKNLDTEKEHILLLRRSRRWRDQILGYVVIHIWKREGGLIGKLKEYAGFREAIVSAIASLFNQFKLDELRLNPPWLDEELRFLLNRRFHLWREKEELPSTPVPLMGHTFRIINFKKLMESFRPYFKERIGQDLTRRLVFGENREKYFIELANERVKIENDADLVRLVFGNFDGEFVAGKGKLKEVLQNIFPLPFPLPGLNYV